MGVLEFMPATRKVLRLLASEPAEFAEKYGVHLHEVAQTVAQHSLAFMKTFPLETSPDWFGHFAIEGESQRLIGICSLKGPPVDGMVEMAFYTFPGFEGLGVATEMARFLPYSMSQGFAPPLFFLQVYLRIPMLWRFFGRQFLVIGRKPR